MKKFIFKKKRDLFLEKFSFSYTLYTRIISFMKKYIILYEKYTWRKYFYNAISRSLEEKKMF